MTEEGARAPRLDWRVRTGGGGPGALIAHARAAPAGLPPPPRARVCVCECVCGGGACACGGAAGRPSASGGPRARRARPGSRSAFSARPRSSLVAVSQVRQARRGGLIVRRRRKRRLRPAGTPGSAALPAGDWSARSPPRSGEGLGPAAGRLRAAGTHLRPPPLRGSGRHPRRWAGPGSAPSPVSAPGVGVGARVCVRGGGGWAAGPQDGGMRG